MISGRTHWFIHNEPKLYVYQRASEAPGHVRHSATLKEVECAFRDSTLAPGFLVAIVNGYQKELENEFRLNDHYVARLNVRRHSLSGKEEVQRGVYRTTVRCVSDRMPNEPNVSQAEYVDVYIDVFRE